MTFQTRQRNLSDPLCYLSETHRRRFVAGGSSSRVWLVSFTDVMALLLAFFVLLFSMTSPERDIMAQIASPFAEQNVVGDLDNAGRFSTDRDERRARSLGRDISYIQTVITQKLETDDALSDVTLKRYADHLRLSLPEGAMFDSGSYAIKPETLPALESLFSIFEGLKNPIEVKGYSDPRPVTQARDGYTSNWGLSLQRAASVTEQLYAAGYRHNVILFGREEQAIATPGGLDDLDLKKMSTQRRVDIFIRGSHTPLF